MNGEPVHLRATPFHGRAAEANETNAWATRGGYTLARAYAGSEDEALAARLRAGLIDISWRWRVTVEGARAAEFLSRLATRDAAKLAPGEAVKALWLSDGGGVRGAGVIARYGKESFRLVAAAPDADWIAKAAAHFDVTVAEIGDREGGLALVGPYAGAVLARAGLDPALEPLAFKKQSWRGFEVTLSRWGERSGYEVWCAAADGILLWDRLMKAGAPFGLDAVGLAAADALDLEAGVPRPGRDYAPAAAGDAATPTPRALGLESLIDEAHAAFNGRPAWRAAREGERCRLVGVEIDAATPASHTPLAKGAAVVGHTRTSVYSPALRRAIALATVDAAASAPGTALSLTLPPSAEVPEYRNAAARVVDLPFLPVPDPISE